MPTIWPLDPHGIAKHLILKLYISAWASILSRVYSEIFYVDGFAGPGVYANNDAVPNRLFFPHY